MELSALLFKWVLETPLLVEYLVELECDAAHDRRVFRYFTLFLVLVPQVVLLSAIPCLMGLYRFASQNCELSFCNRFCRAAGVPFDPTAVSFV